MSKLAIIGGKPIRAKKQWKDSSFGKEELEAVQRVIKSGVLSQFRGGVEVKSFEKQFRKYMGTEYAVATTSGTTALHTALSALSLEEGDEVIVPSFTFVSTASVILQERLIPVFVDIDKTFCLDVKDLKNKITEKTRVIIPVHLFGTPANMPLIKKIARLNNLFIIEDCCQAHGAEIEGKKVGSFGEFGCFSFFQTKNMSCGEGGMITSSNETFYKSARLKREHGSPLNSTRWYVYQTLGYNYNMTELQAAIGKVQLNKLELFNHKRIINAKKYEKALEGLDLTFIKNKPNFKNVYHNFPILLPKYLKGKRDIFVKALYAEGIPVDITYPIPLYKTELFQKTTASCPNAEDVSSRILNLFTDPSLDISLIDDTQKAIEKVLSQIDVIN